MTTIAQVGGFLAAGKTTLILRAAAILQERGKRVAVVLNDQDAGLVDSRLVEAHGVPSAEVAGGCFCCRFGDLLDVADHLRGDNPDVIFAEPVGSCIDLSATVLQPLKAYHGDVHRLAPLTVVVDPGREPDYIAQNQIDEADIICASKSDLYPRALINADYRVSGIAHAPSTRSLTSIIKYDARPSGGTSSTERINCRRSLPGTNTARVTVASIGSRARKTRSDRTSTPAAESKGRSSSGGIESPLYDGKEMTRMVKSLLLAAALLLAGCGSRPPADAKRYPMQGVVKSLDARTKSAMIDAGKIGDWMEPMTMEYPIKPDSEFQKLKVGDKIEATVVVSDPAYYVTDIKVK